MKLFWQSSLMFSSFVLMPTASVFLIYAIGAMVLQAQWELFLVSVGAFIAAVIVQAVFAILSE